MLEIKRPFSIGDSTPCKAPYLELSENGYKLKRSHDHFYQVQGQLAIVERGYCDFIVWAPHGLHVERIYSEPAFFHGISKQLEGFFIKIILPKLLLGSQTAHSSETTSCDVYCYCNQGEFGDMILCDSPACKSGWFHFTCVGIISPPKGAWWCPDCVELRVQKS